MIQNYLEIITKNKLQNNFMAIFFNFNMWDYYLSDLEKNKIFWEFLKDNLSEGSLSFLEVVDSLHYIEKYIKRGFVEMLEIINNHYEKLKYLSNIEAMQIIMAEFITQNNSDDPEKIKEYYSFIVSQKLKDKYETIHFSIDIWNYYIFNQYQLDFLTFLEKKLFEQALNANELLDCFTYSSHLRNRVFLSMLELINLNFDKILYIFRNENKSVNIENYITQNIQTDDLSKIYEQIKIFIEKEKNNSYNLIKFNVSLWMPYTECYNLDTLRFIRKIIIECRQMDPELNEDIIQLAKKIHDVGSIYIRKGMMVGENLIQFLGEDETFYVEKQINDLTTEKIDLQNQVKNQGYEINELITDNYRLNIRVNSLESQLNSLQNKYSALISNMDRLESKISSLDNEIRSVRNDVRGSQIAQIAQTAQNIQRAQSRSNIVINYQFP